MYGGYAVSLQEFTDFYQDISACVDSDDYFVALVTSSWLNNTTQFDHQHKQRPSSAYNLRPRNHGGQARFSGQVSKENTIGPVTKYYDGRESPIRKSIAYSPAKMIVYKEVPG